MADSDPGTDFTADVRPHHHDRPGVAPAIANTANVTASTSLTSNGQQPAMLSNLGFSDIVQSRNLSFENATAHQQSLSQVGIGVVGKTVSRVSNLSPREARSAVDVMTSSELAAQLAALRGMLSAFDGGGGGGGGGAAQSFMTEFEHLIAELGKVLERNKALRGSGTRQDPYRTDGTLYVEAPVSLVFAGVAPDDIKFAVENTQIQARK
jgi:hypothetical protein